MEYAAKTPSQLGSILKGFRRQRQLTQMDTGAKVGLRQNAVSELESDPAPSSVARLFRLLSALDVELVVRDRTERPKSSAW